MQQKTHDSRLIDISNKRKASHLFMFCDSLDLAPGEVAADRYEPADEATSTSQVSAAELAEWEAHPLF